MASNPTGTVLTDTESKGWDLYHSIRGNQPKEVEAGLECLKSPGHTVNDGIWFGYNALCTAFIDNWPGIVQMVLDSGANMFHSNAQRNNVMHQTIRWVLNYREIDTDRQMCVRISLIARFGGETCVFSRNNYGTKPVGFLNYTRSTHKRTFSMLKDMEKRIYLAYHDHVIVMIPIKPLVAIVMDYLID